MYKVSHHFVMYYRIYYVVHERVEQLSEKLEYLFTSKQNQQALPMPHFRGGKKPIGSILTRKLKPSSSSKV